MGETPADRAVVVGLLEEELKKALKLEAEVVEKTEQIDSHYTLIEGYLKRLGINEYITPEGFQALRFMKTTIEADDAAILKTIPCSLLEVFMPRRPAVGEIRKALEGETAYPGIDVEKLRKCVLIKKDWQLKLGVPKVKAEKKKSKVKAA